MQLISITIDLQTRDMIQAHAAKQRAGLYLNPAFNERAEIINAPHGLMLQCSVVFEWSIRFLALFKKSDDMIQDLLKQIEPLAGENSQAIINIVRGYKSSGAIR